MSTSVQAPTNLQKQLLGVYQPGSNHVVGDGFHVRNFFPSHELGAEVSPFLLLDYAGPTYYAPSLQPRGVGEHPHRGFETVTIVYQGAVEHRDSAGNAGTIRTGDVQWMTAASGIVHEEKHEKEFARRGGTLEAVQLWVNLPRAMKMGPPRYQTLLNGDIPVVSLEHGAGSLRVIAGELQGPKGPAAANVQSFMSSMRRPVPRLASIVVLVASNDVPASVMATPAAPLWMLAPSSTADAPARRSMPVPLVVSKLVPPLAESVVPASVSATPRPPAPDDTTRPPTRVTSAPVNARIASPARLSNVVPFAVSDALE